MRHGYQCTICSPPFADWPAPSPMRYIATSLQCFFHKTDHDVVIVSHRFEWADFPPLESPAHFEHRDTPSPCSLNFANIHNRFVRETKTLDLKHPPTDLFSKTSARRQMRVHSNICLMI